MSAPAHAQPVPSPSEGAPSLCYITTCKGRLHHLRQTLPRVVGQPGVGCVVVDYDCPDRAGDWVAAHFPQVTVVRVRGETGFHAARARNLGAQAARAPWLGFFDADILWAPDLAREVVPRLRPGHFYRAQPLTLQTWGSVICRREDFAALGGYDEAYTGWGGEDDDLVARLSLLGRQAAGFAAALLSEIPHDEGARMRFHDIKDRRLQHRVNVLYLQAKLDLMRLSGAAVPLDLRQRLAAEVRRVVQAAWDAAQGATTVSVHLPAHWVHAPLAHGQVDRWQLRRTVVYSIDIAATQPAGS